MRKRKRAQCGGSSRVLLIKNSPRPHVCKLMATFWPRRHTAAFEVYVHCGAVCVCVNVTAGICGRACTGTDALKKLHISIKTRWPRICEYVSVCVCVLFVSDDARNIPNVQELLSASVCSR